MTDARKARLEQMLGLLWNCGAGEGCTRTEIAEMLGLKKTPHLVSLIRQLVNDGWIVEQQDTRSWPHRWRYTPSDKLAEWHAENPAA